MGRNHLEPVRTPFFTFRTAVALAVASVLLLLLGFAVREAEFNQVGSSNSASMWTFVASGICLYLALFVIWMIRRNGRQQRGRR